MAYNKTSTSDEGSPRANHPGKVSRIRSAASHKNLLELDVCINDSSEYSPYYFNIIRKPHELKLGGSIFEFAPPRNKFKLGTDILFEVVDSQNTPLSYKILPKKPGSISIRICIFLYKHTPPGPATISLVGEALLDECGCPLPEECVGISNVRWSSIAQIRVDDVSDVIEYDTAPIISVSETKIPWTYQTYEDVYSINPGTPGAPYTVSGSYIPTYNSQPTGGNSGKFTYTRDIEPDTSSLGQGTLQVYYGDLRFSASMVGGVLYVSGGSTHINGAQPFHSTMVFPAYYATISAVINDTTAEVIPAYGAFQYEMGTFYPRSFDAKQGAQLYWTETSASIAYTDPTAGTTTMQTVASTVEQHTSFADISILGLKPTCGVTTDVEVYIKSTRAEGIITKLTEFPIEPTNIAVDDSRTTAGNNTQVFESIGNFTGNEVLQKYWQVTGSTSVDSGDISFTRSTEHLMDSAKISGTGGYTNNPINYIAFSQHPDYVKALNANTTYYVEFDAYSELQLSQDIRSKIDIYVSGSSISPTNLMSIDERTLGEHIGSIENISHSPTGQTFIGNSFEFKNQQTEQVKVLFVLRIGTWSLSNIKITTAPGTPSTTGITPNSIRALVPMPAITKYNDQYTFELRYKNKNTTANKISTLSTGVQFEGNDPNAFLASQPGANTLSPWFHGLTALTSSKHVYISGNLYVSQSVFASEFHTRVVTSSILFQEGDTIFGNTVDDTHEFVGNITASSINGVGGNISASGELFGGLENATTINTVFYNDVTGQLTYGSLPGFPYSGSDNRIPPTGTPPQAVITGSLYVSSSAGGGHITASGDISASGDIHAKSLRAYGENEGLNGYPVGMITRLGAAPNAHRGVMNLYEGTTVAVRIAAGYPSYIIGGDNTTSYALGIGTVNPTEKLQVLGNISASGQLNIGNIGSTNGHITASGNISSSLVSTGSFGRLEVTSVSASGDGYFANVGIGTTYPTAKLHVSGTAKFQGNTYITGNLYVTDIIVAQEFHTEFVSASITYSSGSNKMGDTIDDIQQMTGSFRVSGSGPHYFTAGDVTESAKLGINTPTPTYELDVVGGIRASAHLFASTSNAAGQPYLTVMVDTGSGQFYYSGSYGGNVPPGHTDLAISGSWRGFITGSGIVSSSGGFKIRDDDNDDVTITENKYIKFVTATGTAGTELAGTGTTEDPYVMTLTSPNTSTDTTYTVSAEAGVLEGGGEDTSSKIIRLTAGGSGTGNDDIVIAAGTGLSIAESADVITLTNTVTNVNTTTQEDVRAAGALMDDEVTGQIAAVKGLTTNGALDWTLSTQGTIHATNYSYRPIDDSPVNGVTNESISSNWAYDHNAGTGNSAHVPAQGTSGEFLKHDGSFGEPNYIANTNTTYVTSVEDPAAEDTSSKIIRLTAGGSGTGNDDITLTAGTGLSIASTGDVITLTNTVAGGDDDTDTTYTISIAAGEDTQSKVIRLTAGGDGSGNDDVTLTAGTGLSVASTGDVITFTNSNPTDTNTTTQADVRSAGAVMDDEVDANITTLVLPANTTLTTNNTIDWTVTQTANIHSTNYTTYTVGDGGLTQVNFTTADDIKLDGIQVGATNTATHTVGDGGLTEINFTTADDIKLDGIQAGATNTATHTVGDGGLTQVNFTTTRKNELMAAVTASGETTQNTGLGNSSKATIHTITNVTAGSIFIDYVFSCPDSGSTEPDNMRAGTITIAVNASSMNYTINDAPDIGTLLNLVISAEISGTSINIGATLQSLPSNLSQATFIVRRL